MAIFDEQAMIEQAGGKPKKGLSLPLKKKEKNSIEPLITKEAKIPLSFQKEKRKMRKKQQKSRQKVKRSIAEILPISDITETGVFILRDESFMDIWQLGSKNVYGMNDQETRFSIYHLAHLFQAYSHSLKIVALNFPVSTNRQQAYIQRKIQECTNDLYRGLLEQKLRELEYLEFKRTNREFYCFIYGETEFAVRERIEMIQRLIQKTTPLFSISEDKKVEVLFKLFNQNSKLGTKY